MTPELDVVVREIQVLTTLAIAAFLWYVGWRRYRLDLFRQRLFALRDELFDIAATGDLRFNDYAYGGLRRLLNNTIRFGHRVNSMQLLVVGICGGDPPEAIEKPYRDWLKSIDAIENETVREQI